MVVGEDDRRAFSRQAPEQIAQTLGSDGVDAREGLVAHEHTGKPGDGARELEPATLARRELPGADVEPLLEAHAGGRDAGVLGSPRG